MAKAKAKAKTKKAGKKSAGEKLPKTIAGVKVPKDLRSPAARAKRYVEAHPVISEAVAAGMLAAAAALMADKVGKDGKGGGKAKTVLKAAAAAVGGRLMAEAKGTLGLGGKSAAKPASGAKSPAAKGRTARQPA